MNIVIVVMALLAGADVAAQPIQIDDGSGGGVVVGYGVAQGSVPVGVIGNVSVNGSTVAIVLPAGTTFLQGYPACALTFGTASVSSTTVATIVAAIASRGGGPTVCMESTTGSVTLGSSTTIVAGGSMSIGGASRCWWPEGPGVSTTAVTGIAAAGTSGSLSLSWQVCQ